MTQKTAVLGHQHTTSMSKAVALASTVQAAVGVVEVKKPFMPEQGQPVRGKGVDCKVTTVYADSFLNDKEVMTYTVGVKSGDVYQVIAGSNFWQVVK